MLRFTHTRKKPKYPTKVAMHNLDSATYCTIGGETSDSENRDGSDESDDHQETDVSHDLDVTTIKEAITESDFVCLKTLLEAGVPIEDNLFYAISCGSLNAVKMICAYLKMWKGVQQLHEVINGQPKGVDYLSTATPLQIAAQHNDYEIVKVLTRHGAVMPRLDMCLNQVESDIIVRSLVFLLYMRAVCSPAMLVAKETNPVGRALRLAINLEDNSFINETNGWFVNHRSFTESLNSIRFTLEEFLCDILNHCKNRQEVDAILEVQANHKFDEEDEEPEGFLKMLNTWEDSVLPPGLEQAIALRFKKYVSHPYVQMVLMERAFDGPVPWSRMCSFRFGLFSTLLVLISPFLCVAYALFPFPKLVKLMQTPYVRVLNTFSSHLFFMCFLLLTALNMRFSTVDCPDIPNQVLTNVNCVLVEHRFWDIKSRVWILSLIILGEAMWLLYNFYRTGIRTFMRQVWNWINIIQTTVFFISLCAHITSMVQTRSHWNAIMNPNATLPSFLVGRPNSIPKYVEIGPHLFETSRQDWETYDSVLLAELTFAIGNILTVQRLLYTFTLLEFFGPLVISISRLFKILSQFLITTILILVAFALGLTQLFAPYQQLPPCENANEESYCGDVEMFRSFRQSLLTLFWSIFGDFKITAMTLPQNLRLINYSGHILHAIFVVLMTIVILNMLIATIINVYDSIRGNLDQEWKFARTKLLEEYLGDRANLPAPYNVIPSVRFIYQTLSSVYHYLSNKTRKIKSKVMNTDFGSEYNWSRHYHDTTGEGNLRQINFKVRHKVVTDVVGRYKNDVFSCYNWTTEREEGIEHLPIIHRAARRNSSIYNKHAYKSNSIRRRKTAVSQGEHVCSNRASFCFQPIFETEEGNNRHDLDTARQYSRHSQPLLSLPVHKPVPRKSASLTDVKFPSTDEQATISLV
ncbi:Short transient receptor potential channel 5 [Holothuria leucospilota]|uniref:Short transient receptor potential channel 5 n=1 Tax=Holothuria leucospilota TaxID=206669 RepID=A0A9Q0YL78_HOLLE|nr:Short transient receptor potential channel 5 [Holothuria leucospilota]